MSNQRRKEVLKCPLDIPNRSVGYRRLGKGAPKVSTNTDVSWKLGGGGFISSVEDMAKFAEGLLNGELMEKASYQSMWTPQTLANGDATTVGLGFFVETENGQLKVSHNGAQEKTRTRMVLYPESGSGVVVMTNTEHGEPGKISTAIYQALNR
jgi:CubicO group peptidase (beta-lactamase class C family)